MFRQPRSYPEHRTVTIRPVKRVQFSPSITKRYYELLIDSGYTTYRAILGPMQFFEAVQSAENAAKGIAPPFEMRASTMLPMNPAQLFLVRATDGVAAKDLFHSLYNAWHQKYYLREAVGSVQQAIRLDAVQNLPLRTGPLKYVATVMTSAASGPIRANDILVQRVSGTPENLGRPFFVESATPLLIRGA